MNREIKISVLAFACFLFVSIPASFSGPSGDADKEPVMLELDNGMRVILIENHSTPMVASTVVVGAGTIYESPQVSGASHMLEHLLFNGTERRTQKELYDEVDLLGAYNNAFTRDEYTGYIFVVPKDELAQCLDIQADMLLHSVIPADKLEKEKGIVIEEIGKDKQNPNTGFENFFKKNLYRSTPLDKPVIGTTSTVSAFDRKAIFDYYKTMYVPANMVLLCMGDFTKDEILPLIQKTFGGVPGGKRSEAPKVQIAWPKVPILYEGKLDGRVLFLSMAFPAPPSESGDFFPFLMLAQLLDSGYESALKEKLNAGSEGGPPKALRTSVSYEFHPDHPYLEVFVMSPGIVDPEELAKQIAELLSTFSESGPGAEEVKLALLKMRADDYALGEKLYLYGIMKAPFLAGAPLAYLLNYRDSLNGVGPWDIRRVAKKYLASSPYIAAAMGPMLPESASKEMKPAEAPKPSQGAPAGTQERKRQVKAYALENGLRVMLDENPESHVFAVHLLVKNRSVSEPAGKEGIADFLHRLLEKGAADLEENQLNRKLAEIAGTLQVTDNPYIPFDDYYFTGEYSYIRLETIDEFGQEALKLLAHLIQSPRMEESDIAAVAEEMVSVVKRDAGKPSAVAKRLFYENLLPKSPLKNPLLGTETSIASISSADLAAFHKDYFAPDNLILSVVGNAPIEQMEAWVKDAFGKMEKREISPSAERLAPAFSKKGKRAEEKVGKEQSQILIGTLVQMKKLDLPALIVMNEVLSQRLAFNLREKQGLAYSIGSALHIASGGESPWGWIAASMGTRPENIEKAQEGILREMKGMRTGVLSEMELKKAVSRYTGEALRRRLPSMGRAYMLDLDDFFGWPADFSVKILEDMKKLKPEDVKNAARKYLDLDSMTVAVAR